MPRPTKLGCLVILWVGVILALAILVLGDLVW